MGPASPDDGFSPMSPDRYVEIRLSEQPRYYRRRALRVHRAFFVAWQIAILGLGGLGTLLAALNQAVDKLVEHGEKVMESEMAGWVQKMQDALVELRKDDESTRISAVGARSLSAA
jgi:hypothetical protein